MLRANRFARQEKRGRQCSAQIGLQGKGLQGNASHTPAGRASRRTVAYCPSEQRGKRGKGRTKARVRKASKRACRGGTHLREAYTVAHNRSPSSDVTIRPNRGGGCNMGSRGLVPLRGAGQSPANALAKKRGGAKPCKHTFAKEMGASPLYPQQGGHPAAP